MMKVGWMLGLALLGGASSTAAEQHEETESPHLEYELLSSFAYDTCFIGSDRALVFFELCFNNNKCQLGHMPLEMYLDIVLEHFQAIREIRCDRCSDECEGKEDGDDDEEEDVGDDNVVAEARGGGRALEQEEGYYDDDDDYYYDDDGYYNVPVDCDTCWEECERIENMEENGYLDASEFRRCTMIYDRRNERPLFAGPICSEDGTKYNVRVFEDEACHPDSLVEDLQVDDFLSDEYGNRFRLSYASFRETFDAAITCQGGETENICEWMQYESWSCPGGNLLECAEQFGEEQYYDDDAWGDDDVVPVDDWDDALAEDDDYSENEHEEEEDDDDWDYIECDKRQDYMDDCPGAEEEEEEEHEEEEEDDWDYIECDKRQAYMDDCPGAEDDYYMDDNAPAAAPSFNTTTTTDDDDDDSILNSSKPKPIPCGVSYWGSLLLGTVVLGYYYNS